MLKLSTVLSQFDKCFTYSNSKYAVSTCFYNNIELIGSVVRLYTGNYAAPDAEILLEDKVKSAECKCINGGTYQIDIEYEDDYKLIFYGVNKKIS